MLQFLLVALALVLAPYLLKVLVIPIASVQWGDLMPPAPHSCPTPSLPFSVFWSGVAFGPSSAFSHISSISAPLMLTLGCRKTSPLLTGLSGAYGNTDTFETVEAESPNGTSRVTAQGEGWFYFKMLRQERKEN